jgi:hypothetical protein
MARANKIEVDAPAATTRTTEYNSLIKLALSHYIDFRADLFRQRGH